MKRYVKGTGLWIKNIIVWALDIFVRCQILAFFKIVLVGYQRSFGKETTTTATTTTKLQKQSKVQIYFLLMLGHNLFLDETALNHSLSLALYVCIVCTHADTQDWNCTAISSAIQSPLETLLISLTGLPYTGYWHFTGMEIITFFSCPLPMAWFPLTACHYLDISAPWSSWNCSTWVTLASYICMVAFSLACCNLFPLNYSLQLTKSSFFSAILCWERISHQHNIYLYTYPHPASFRLSSTAFLRTSFLYSSSHCTSGFLFLALSFYFKFLFIYFQAIWN